MHPITRKIFSFQPWGIVANRLLSCLRYHHNIAAKYFGCELPYLQKAVRRLSWEAKEIKIPIPFGFIAAKVWGPEHGLPVLALHGWQDNAGTFDDLIPLLSPSLHIVAIDFPGHGLSSHKPLGTFYHYMEMLLDTECVVRHLKWEKFSVIGHSMGGHIGVLYASLFPDSVQNIVMLDVIKPTSRTCEALPDITKDAMGELLELESKMDVPAPVYSPEGAKARLMRGLYGNFTERAADVLMRRGTKASSCGTGVIFTRDIRLKAIQSLQKLSHDDVKAYMRRLECNMLIIIGKDSFVFQTRTPEVVQDFVGIYREVCKIFQFVEVEGNHFVHVNQPDRVAPHINSFFDRCLCDESKE